MGIMEDLEKFRKKELEKIKAVGNGYEEEKEERGVRELRDKLKAKILAGEIKDRHIEGDLKVDIIEEDELLLWDEIESLKEMDERRYEELADKVNEMMLERVKRQTPEEIRNSPSNNLLSFLTSLLIKKTKEFGVYEKKKVA